MSDLDINNLATLGNLVHENIVLRQRVAELEFGHDAMAEECKDWQERLADCERDRDELSERVGWCNTELNDKDTRLAASQHYAQQLEQEIERLKNDKHS